VKTDVKSGTQGEGSRKMLMLQLLMLQMLMLQTQLFSARCVAATLQAFPQAVKQL
jgi:hypothetical protein